MNTFTTEDATDTPRAIAIDRSHPKLYLAGSSGDEWPVGRVNIEWGGTGYAWHAHFLTGTANALWLDSSQNNTRLGVAGTSATGEIQVVMLYAFDTPAPPGDPVHMYPGGAFDKSFGGGTGYATAPAPATAVSAVAPVAASASAILALDNLPFFNRSPARKSVIGFRQDGTISTRFSNNRGLALFTIWGDGAVVSHVGSAVLTGRSRALDLAQPLNLW